MTARRIRDIIRQLARVGRDKYSPITIALRKELHVWIHDGVLDCDPITWEPGPVKPIPGYYEGNTFVPHDGDAYEYVDKAEKAAVVPALA